MGRSLTGAQGSAVMEAVDLGGGRLHAVAGGKDGLRFFVQKPLHLIATTTVIIHVFRHDSRSFG